MSSIPRIGIDAMGGDFGSLAVAEGTALALREMPGRFRVTLVGDETEIRSAIRQLHAEDLPIDVVHAPERIEMAEKAAAAVRKKSQSSLVVMTQLHRDGQLDAIFSAGNTGAVVATALLGLGRLQGATRPALAVFAPNAGDGRGTVVLDVGANAECKPAWLVQWAHMGAVYAKHLLNIEEPRVGLLSIGEEDTKGNSLVLETLPLLRRAQHLKFLGNLEGRDAFNGSCDVLVTDGFTGNVLLKTAESIASLIGHMIRDELRNDWLARMGVLFMAPALKRLRTRMDWEEHGAAPLLGVNGVCFVGHGSSSPRAIRSALRMMAKYVEQRVNEHIREEIQSDHVTAA